MYGYFLNKGIIMCGVAVTLCIIMAAFSVSVRLCYTCIRGNLRGYWQAGKAGQLIRQWTGSKFCLQCKQSALLLGRTKLFVCTQQRMCISAILLFMR